MVSSVASSDSVWYHCEVSNRDRCALRPTPPYRLLALFLLSCIGLFSLPSLASGDPTCSDSYLSVVLPNSWCAPRMMQSDPLTGIIYAACGEMGGVIRVNQSEMGVLATAEQCQAQAIHFDPTTGTVYAACTQTGIIAIHGNQTLTTLATAEQCAEGSNLFTDAERGVLYAACGASGIIAIEGSTIHTIATGEQCKRAKDVKGANGLLYAACTDSGIIVINGTTITQPVPWGNCMPIALSIRPLTGIAYVACMTSIISFGPDGAMTTLATSIGCQTPSSVWVDPLSGVVYAGCFNGPIAISGQTITPLAGTNMCTYAAGVYYDSSLGVAFVSCGAYGGFTVRASVYGTVSTVGRSDGIQSLYLSPTSRTVYAAGAEGVDTYDGQQFTQIINPNICLASSVFFDAENDVVYAGCQQNNPIVAVRGNDTFPLLPSLQDRGGVTTLYGSSSNRLYAGFVQDGLIVIDLTTGNVTTLLSSCDASKVYVDSDTHGGGDMVYVACRTFGTFRINMTSGSILQLVDPTVCDESRSVYHDSSVGLTYIGCEKSGILVVSDSNPNITTTIASAQECGAALDVTRDTETGVVYAACWDDGIIAIENGVVQYLLPSSQFSARSVVRDRVSGVIYAACPDVGFIAISTGFDCYPGTHWSGGTCQLCQPHTYRNASHTPFASCMPCPTGSVAPAVGSYECTPCPTGTIEVDRVCASCMPGRYQPHVQQTACLDCAPGRMMSGVGAAACEECQPGSFSNTNGTSVCPYCILGSAQPSYGETSCSACTAGFYAGESGLDACWACSPGSASSVGGARSCPLCTPGRYQPSLNGTTCIPAPKGYHIDVAGATTPTPCQPGAFSEHEATVSCQPCLPGTYQPKAGQTACTACQPGSYAIFASSTACVTCDPGFYSADPGSASCLPCSPGSASNATGLDESCPGCAPGTYQGGLGKTVCDECEPNYYAERSYATSCTKCNAQVNPERTACNTTVCPANYQYQDQTGTCDVCPLGSYSSAGGLCTVCSVNTYTPFAGSGCISCQQSGMTGLICSGGLASVAPGYWAWIEESDGAGVHSDSSVHTALSQSSIGFPLFHTALCPVGFCPGARLQSSPVNLNDSASPLCLYPRLDSPDNVFCGQCEKGYIPWGDSCVECSGVNGGVVFGGLILCFLLVLFLFASSRVSSAGGVTVLLFFVQTGALEVGPVARFIDWIHIVNLDATSTGVCIAPWSPYQQTLFSLLLPVLLTVQLFIVGACHYCLYRRFASTPPSPSSSRTLVFLFDRISTFSLNEYFGGVMAILLFCYTQVAKTAMQYLYCVDVASEQVVFNAPTIDCHSDEYRRYLIPVLSAIAVYIAGFPLAIIGLLWKNRSTVSLASSVDVSQLRSGERRFLARWSPLFRMYHSRAFFWQSLVLARRAAFVLVAVFLIQQANVRFMAFTLLNFASIQVHQLIQPFDSSIINRLENASYMLLVCLSILLTTYTPPYTPAIQVCIFLLIVPATIVFVAFTVYQQCARVNGRLGPSRSHLMRDGDDSPTPIDLEYSTNSLTEAHSYRAITDQQHDNKHHNRNHQQREKDQNEQPNSNHT